MWLELIIVVVSWAVVAHQWRRQRVPPLPRVRPVPPHPSRIPSLVSIILPARNEGTGIESCVRSLLAQDYPSFEIIAVDDCSEDDTRLILDRLAAADPRLRVIHGVPLPPGWMGKAHAIVQGYRAAQGDWLLFTDADTEHASWLLSGVMALLRDSPASVATVIASLRHPSHAVYLVQLAVLTCIRLLTDFRRLQEPRSRTSLVNGQYVIFAREAYEAIGTHAAVRHCSSTDVSLGYLAKLQGWMLLLLNGRDGLRTTMYRTVGQALHGWSRSAVNVAWTAFGRTWGSLALLAAMAAMGLFWVVPWMLVVRGVVDGEPVALQVGALQLVAGLSVMRLLGRGWWSAVKATLEMPASCLFFIAIGGAGLVRAWSRGGTVWKGRVVRTARGLPPWQPHAPRARGLEI